MALPSVRELLALPTSEACPSLPPVAVPPPPTVARRHDSAFAHHHHPEPCHDAVSTPSPVEPDLSCSRHSPPHSRSPAQPSARPPQTHITAYPRSHERRPSPPAKNPAPTLLPDHSAPSTTTTTRQQRYNVRFVANHTPANMPAAQRSRHSPPVQNAPATPETVESPPVSRDEQVAPTIEPAIQALSRSLQQPDDQFHAQARAKEPSVERCDKCHQAWTRPVLPHSSSLGKASSTESENDFVTAKASFQSIVSRLQQHSKDADAKYAEWKDYHQNRCARKEPRLPDPTPSHTPSTTDTTPGRRPDSESRESAPSQPTSNKRKSEIPHGDTTKSRRVTFTDTTGPSLARPSTPRSTPPR